MLESTANPVSTTKNCGVATVEEGAITKEELAVEFGNIYKTNWPWQIRELGDWSYLVKFPPYPCGTGDWVSQIWSVKRRGYCQCLQVGR
jgi:hypothetical protein